MSKLIECDPTIGKLRDSRVQIPFSRLLRSVNKVNLECIEKGFRHSWIVDCVQNVVRLL